MSDQPKLLVSTPADGVLQLTFNRPEVHNAFDMETFAALEAEFDRSADDETVRAIVIAARGGKAFSAGFDIHEMAAFDKDAMRHAFERRDPVMRKVATHPRPIIAAVDGICYGGGALLALACDFRLATPAFRLKVTAVGYGGANATWSLPRLVGPARAKSILMTGRVVLAQEALQIGLIDEVIAPDALESRAVEMASMIAAHPAEGVAGIKQLVDDSLNLTPEQGWRAEYDWMIAQMENAPAGGDTFSSFLATHERRH